MSAIPNRMSNTKVRKSTEITLAYAITVHKSQGSEYHTVIMVLVNSHAIMLQRNLFYTAVPGPSAKSSSSAPSGPSRQPSRTSARAAASHCSSRACKENSSSREGRPCP